MNYVAFLLCCIKPSSCLAWILCGVYAEIVYLSGGDLDLAICCAVWEKHRAPGGQGPWRSWDPRRSEATND